MRPFFGFRAQRVQRGRYRRFAAMSFIIPLRGKAKQPPCGRRKCTPFGAAHHFPRRGKFTLRSTFTLISSSKYSVAKISPSGGDVATGDRRGAFPMWRPCRGSPSRAKLVLSLHIKGLSNKSPDRCRRRGCLVFAAIGSDTANSGMQHFPLNQPGRRGHSRAEPIVRREAHER